MNKRADSFKERLLKAVKGISARCYDFCALFGMLVYMLIGLASCRQVPLFLRVGDNSVNFSFPLWLGVALLVIGIWALLRSLIVWVSAVKDIVRKAKDWSEGVR